MLEVTLVVTNKLGLHARAAAQLVRLANKHKSSVKLVRHDTKRTADAKDILSVLHLAAACNAGLTVFVDGEDEIETIDQIEKLFVGKFGEE